MESREKGGQSACRCGTYLATDQNGYCPECEGKRGVPITPDEIDRMHRAIDDQKNFADDQAFIDAAEKIGNTTPPEPGSVIVPPRSDAAETVQQSLNNILNSRRKRRGRRSGHL